MSPFRYLIIEYIYSILVVFCYHRCLVSYCYSLWFVVFPSYVHSNPKKYEALKVGLAVLKKMQQAKLLTTDEVSLSHKLNSLHSRYLRIIYSKSVSDMSNDSTLYPSLVVLQSADAVIRPVQQARFGCAGFLRDEEKWSPSQCYHVWLL